MKKAFLDFLNIVKQVFCSPDGRLSSKRVFGGMGWMVCLWVLIHCTLKHVEAPVITEVIVIVSATLMGVGIFDSYGKKKINKYGDKEDTTE